MEVDLLSMAHTVGLNVVPIGKSTDSDVLVTVSCDDVFLVIRESHVSQHRNMSNNWLVLFHLFLLFGCCCFADLSWKSGSNWSLVAWLQYPRTK